MGVDRWHDEWVESSEALADLTAYLARALPEHGRPREEDLQRRVDLGLQIARLTRDGSGRVVAGYVVYPLTAECVGRVQAGTIATGRDIKDADITNRSSAGGVYISVVAADESVRRRTIVDLVGVVRAVSPSNVFARAATPAGGKVMLANGFRPVTTGSEIQTLSLEDVSKTD